MKFSFLTLGCKANQFDTQAMEALVQARGHTLTDTAPDVLVINTCTVTGEADRKCRQVIRRARRENPAVLLAVCGCMAQSDPEAARNLGADIVGGAGDRDLITQLPPPWSCLPSALPSKRPRCCSGPPQKLPCFHPG